MPMLLRITRRSCMEQWGELQWIYLLILLMFLSDIKITCSRSGSHRGCRLILLGLTFGTGLMLCDLYRVTDLKSCRGNHESGGQWRQGGFTDDVEDLVTVVAYLRFTYGYEIDVVVGHSRGSVVGMHWLCTSEEGKRVRALVNVSGRYRMHVSLKVSFLFMN